MTYLNYEKLILASQSPRRKTLLETAGINLTVKASDIDETPDDRLSNEDLVKDLAKKKAKDVARLYPQAWVLGADTIVVIDNHILGKPESSEDAVSKLERLNNRTHEVYTGFCLYHHQKDTLVAKAVCTQVVFKNLTGLEINWYVNTGEPLDKAGAYGIQGIGSFLVKKIFGSYTNVVGLPVCEVVQELSDLNLIHM